MVEQGVGHVSFRPGDIGRDKLTNTDYVVQTVISMAGGAGLVVYGLALYGNHIAKFQARNYAHLDDQLLLVKKNVTGLLQPHEVKQKFHDDLNRLFNYNREVLEKIAQPENQMLRDLLMLTSDTSHSTVEKSIVDLAESIVTFNKGIPSKKSILESLYNIADENTSKDLIENLAERLHKASISSQRIKVGQGRSKFLSSENSVNLPNISILKKAEQLLAKEELNYSEQKARKELIQLIAGDSGVSSARLHGTILENVKGKTPSERFREAVRATFHEPEPIINKYEKQVLRDTQKGKTHFVIKAILDRNKDLTENAAKLQFIHDQENTGFHRYMKGSYGRATAMNSGGRKARLRPIGNWNLAANLKDFTEEGHSRFVSLDGETFLNQLIGDKQISFGGKVSNLNDAATRKHVIKTMNLYTKSNTTGEQYISFTPSQINHIVNSKDPLDIHQLAEWQREVSGALPTDIKGRIMRAGEETGLPMTIGTINIPLKAPTSMRITPNTSVTAALNSHLPSLDPTNSRLFYYKPNELLNSPGQEAIYASTDADKLLHRIHAEGLIDAENIQNLHEASESRTLQYIDVPSHLLRDEQREVFDLLSHEKLGSIDINAGTKVIQDAGILYNSKMNLTTAQGLREASKLQQLLHTAVEGVGRIHARGEVVVAEAYEIEKSRMRVAFASITKKKDITMLLGTEMNSSVEEQIARARRFYKTNSAYILDIETLSAHGSDTKFLREAAIIKVDNSGRINKASVSNIERTLDLRINNNEPRFSGNTAALHAERAEGLISIGHALKDAEVVGTHSASDFNEMNKMLDFYLEHYKGNKAMLSRLKYTKNTFNDVVKNKLLDLQMIYQVGGEKMGRTSQAYLTARYLDKTQTHGAMQDVLDAASLTHLFEGIFEKNQANLQILSNKEAHQIGSVYMDTDPLSRNAGRIRSIVGVNTSHGDDAIRLTFEEMKHSFVDGKYTLEHTGKYFEEGFDTVYQAGASIRRATQLTTENMGQAISKYSSLLEEQGLRRVRAYLNPLAKTYWDEVGGYNPLKQGPFNATQLVVDSEAKRLFKQVSDIIEPEAAQLNKPSKMQGLTQKVQRVIGEVVENSKQANDLLYSSNFEERVKHQLEKMVWSQNEANHLMDPHSALARFHESDLGGALVDMAKSSLGLRDPNSVDTGYAMFSALFQHHVAGESNIWKELDYGSRFTIKVAGEGITKSLEDIDAIGGISDAVHDVTAKLLLQLRNEGEESGAYKLLEKLHVDAGAAKKMIIEYGNEKGVENNLNEWKGAISSLGYLESSQKYSKLTEVIKTIEESEHMQEAVTEGFLRNKEKLAAAGSDTVKIMDYIVDQANSKTSKTLPFHEALQEEVIKAFKGKNNPIFNEVFNDTREQWHLDSLLQHASPDAIDSIREKTKEYTSLLLGENGDDFKRLNDAIEHMATVRRELWKNPALSPQERMGAEGDALINFLHQQGLLNKQTTGGNGLTEQKALQQMVNATPLVEDVESKLMKAAQHELILTKGLDFGSKQVSKLAVPLMATAGVLGLLAASSGPKEDEFSQGYESSRHGGTLLLNSEMPGRQFGTRVWRGEEKPFALDITFKGFVKNREHHDELMSAVYNAVSGEVDFKQVNSDIQDRRRKNHRMVAIDALNDNL